MKQINKKNGLWRLGGSITPLVLVILMAACGEGKDVKGEVEAFCNTAAQVCVTSGDTVVCFYKPQKLVIGKHETFSHYDSTCLGEGYTPSIRQIEIDLAGGKDSVTQKINRQLLCMYFDKNVESFDEALEEFGDGFFTARLNAREIPAPKGIRSFRSEYYTFEGGGCHGFTETRVFHFNAMTGDSLTFEDIFRIPIESVTRQIDAVIKAREDLAGYLLYYYDVAIPRAFYFDKNGVMFIYDPYDIACYAAGTIEVLVPYTY